MAVGEILEALRAEVRARRAAVVDENSAESALERELQRCIEQLEITRVVSAHWPLNEQTLPQKAIALVNKVVRRGLRWYINPIVEQQNAFNDAAARTLRLLVQAHGELRTHMTEIGSSVVSDPPYENREPGTVEPQDVAASENPAPKSELAPCAAEGNSARSTLRVRSGQAQHAARSTQHAALPAVPSDIVALQALVEEWGRTEPAATFPDLAMRPWYRRVVQHQQVNAHWWIGGATPLEKARALVQRAVRQYLRWLINPIVEQQNGFNAALSEALPPLLAADAAQRATLAERRAQRANEER
jgi:predicted nucleic acid-binding protein